MQHGSCDTRPGSRGIAGDVTGWRSEVNEMHRFVGDIILTVGDKSALVLPELSGAAPMCGQHRRRCEPTIISLVRLLMHYFHYDSIAVFKTILPE